MVATRVISSVTEQLAEQAADLWALRRGSVHRAGLTLHDIATLDERLDANLDGLRVAAEAGWKICLARLSGGAAPEAFVAGVLALESRDSLRISAVEEIVENEPALVEGLCGAYAFVSSADLRGVVKTHLMSRSALRRSLGLAACSKQGVNPGAALDAAIADIDQPLRRQALGMAGELARIDLLPVCIAALTDADAATRLCAASSAALLGNRDLALSCLRNIVDSTQGELAAAALQWLMLASAPQACHNHLSDLIRSQAPKRLIAEGAGWSGDPKYVHWLIQQTAHPTVARKAGESIARITGVDLAASGLTQDQAPQVETGPTDDPQDDNVQMDADGGLLWPHTEGLKAWWRTQASTWREGNRHLLGQAVNLESLHRTLRHGAQPDRLVAARLRSLANPGTPIFDIAAPAWRQERLLEQMGT